MVKFGVFISVHSAQKQSVLLSILLCVCLHCFVQICCLYVNTSFMQSPPSFHNITVDHTPFWELFYPIRSVKKTLLKVDVQKLMSEMCACRVYRITDTFV